MATPINRREFMQTTAIWGGVTWGLANLSCGAKAKNFLYTPPEYDIFFKPKQAKSLVQLDTSKLADWPANSTPRDLWLMRSIITIFQGLVNRIEPMIYLKHSDNDVDWLDIFIHEGYQIRYHESTNFEKLVDEFSHLLNGYIVIDPNMLHTLNVAQTWASLEDWLVITPEMEPMVKKTGLAKKQDLSGRWQSRVEAYQWAFENLFPDCSKHLVGDCCVDFPYHPSPGSFHIRDFLVANRAFTFDLSAAYRQRQEYRLLNKIYGELEFPAGVWGWHCSRDHEHWAVDRAARQDVYTICAIGGRNLTVHGGIKPKEASVPKQKPSPLKNLMAEKNKIYIAFMMTDGDSLWVMNSLQLRNWAAKQRGEFPVSWGFLPLLADIAPAMYLHYIKAMKPVDYMVAGPSGAAYTYPHMYSYPKKFLRYTKFYMQKCGLEIVNITNWNDYTNWQEVDLPWFNPILFKELDNCLGYIRGMGESAFEPHYNFADKPYVFCGEGIHRGDKDDVATIKNFIDANPNRPLFLFCLANIAVSMDRLKTVIAGLQDYPVEYVRLDDFMHLIKSAYRQGLITEDLYPNRSGNERILSQEAPAAWANTKASIDRLVPIITAENETTALEHMDTEQAQLALGQKITDEDKADVLAFKLCENMFALVKNVLNFQGIYVNLRIESVEKFRRQYSDWQGIDVLSKLIDIWQNWDKLTLRWNEVVEIGRKFLQIYQQADELFK